MVANMGTPVNPLTSSPIHCIPRHKNGTPGPVDCVAWLDALEPSSLTGTYRTQTLWRETLGLLQYTLIPNDIGGLLFSG